MVGKMMFGLNAAERHELCAKALIDHRTLLRFLRGENTNGLVKRRLEQAAKRLKLWERIEDARKASTETPSGPVAA